MPPIEGGVEAARENYILFNQSKNELFKLNDAFKILQRKLKSSWKIVINNDEVTNEVLYGVSILILAGPREKFTENEFNVMKKYLETGGSIFVMLAEGGEKKFETNINFLLEEYGIMINSDCVVRTHYYKYFHPKECLIVDGIINKSMLALANGESSKEEQPITFLYPYGATLNVAAPAVAVLSSGNAVFPLNRPLLAFVTQTSPKNSAEVINGKLAVLGSAHVLTDKYVEKEENDKIRSIIFGFLTNPAAAINGTDTEELEIVDYTMVPDVGLLSERPRGYLQESFEDIPLDYTQLFDQKLYSVNMDKVPVLLDAFKTLNVKHEPLRLIPPQFESPLPPLQAAVFPPAFKDLPHPALELFDLEDAFSSERARLSQLANKCLSSNQRGIRKTGTSSDDEINDIKYFIKEAGRILGVGSAQDDAAKVLHSVALHIAEFKKEMSVAQH
ncbi:intraflagellar transport protein 52 homolog isoform X1 [Nilaparvata lugens]|uniref:intraflagellar transport protein 52 homolog isoform X1 n=1 Tax=Nilaparvata lugens TaxID=108931 RepID=UPI00193E78E9|nr:intraflagellar transport protein 52 homolog isoform X1 [Nilaparvata lugens]